MIRDHLFEKRLPTDPLFRWRGSGVSRLEGFSDGVFAVSLTLLLASSTVPGTFHELWQTIRDMPAYVATFAFMYVCWHDHYIYFRRYGMEDGLTKVLNGLFLFLFVSFAFPLKFLGIFLWHTILGMDLDPLFEIQPDLPPMAHWMANGAGQPWTMMAFYSSACLGVYAVFSLMMVRAYRARERLELDQIEVHLTKVSLHHHLVMVVVCALSLAVLIVFDSPSLSGLVYFVLGPAHGVLGWIGGAKTEKLKQALLPARDATDAAASSGGNP